MHTLMSFVGCVGKRLVKLVFMMMMIFVRAEREGDWPLHLWAVREMLPYFFAAGHYEAP